MQACSLVEWGRYRWGWYRLKLHSNKSHSLNMIEDVLIGLKKYLGRGIKQAVLVGVTTTCPMSAKLEPLRP